MGFGVLGLVALFFFAANFSTTESSFQCSGEITNNNISQPSTVYIKLTEYRPWVRSDSDGSLNWELPNEWVGYFGHIEKVGDQFQIYETYPQKTFKGTFSTLSQTLAIDLEAPFGFFDGTCTAN